MASPCLLDGLCQRSHAETWSGSTSSVSALNPDLYQICDPPTSKHIPTLLGTREEKEKKVVPMFLVSTNLKSRENVQKKPSGVQAIRSPKRPQDGNVTPSVCSLKLCV